nr:hypothetical protein [Tanacetum cinerariifolium]
MVYKIIDSELFDRLDDDDAVSLCCLDGEQITGTMVYKIIDSELFDRLDDDDAVSLCCLGILQLVLLGVEGKHSIPAWLLRLANDMDGWDNYPWGLHVWPTLYSQLKNANVKRWPKLYGTQPTSEVDTKSYSIFGYTWAFKTWILESFRVTATIYYYRYNRLLELLLGKKGKFLATMVEGVFHGNLPAKRLTPDETEARSDWWKISENSNPEQVRLNVLTKLQEALDEEAILEEQILALMHRFADRFTDRKVEINNLMVLYDQPLIEYVQSTFTVINKTIASLESSLNVDDSKTHTH